MKQSHRNTALGPLGRSDAPLFFASDRSDTLKSENLIWYGVRFTIKIEFLDLSGIHNQNDGDNDHYTATKQTQIHTINNSLAHQIPLGPQ